MEAILSDLAWLREYVEELDEAYTRATASPSEEEQRDKERAFKVIADAAQMLGASLPATPCPPLPD